VKNISIISVLVMGVFLLFLCTIATAEITVKSVTHDPDKPAPQSDVTFTVEISGDDVSEIRLIVDECNETLVICYAPPLNVSMSVVDTDTYEARVTLQYGAATIAKYYLEINGVRYPSSTNEYLGTFDLVKPSDEGKDKKTPGFELFILVLSIMAIIFYIKKREK
jgi:hypothetical protein